MQSLSQASPLKRQKASNESSEMREFVIEGGNPSWNCIESENCPDGRLVLADGHLETRCCDHCFCRTRTWKTIEGCARLGCFIFHYFLSFTRSVSPYLRETLEAFSGRHCTHREPELRLQVFRKRQVTIYACSLASSASCMHSTSRHWLVQALRN